MSTLTRERGKYALGLALIIGLAIGGGTAAGLMTDTIVQVVVILAVAVEFSRPRRSPVGFPIVVMALAVLGAMILQVVPLPTAILDALRPDLVGADVDVALGEPRLSPISLGVGRTIETIFFVAASLGLFLAVLRLRPDQVVGLLPFFFLGVGCNVLAAAIQYSVARDVAIDGLLPYKITAGFFANVNHFSSLLFISIPLITYYGIISGRLRIALVGLAAILILLLAAGSRAGVAIGFALTVLSLLFLVLRGKASILFVTAAFIGLSVYGLGAWTKFDLEALDPEFGRAEFVRTTIDGIEDNWILGVGYGNFPNAYQIYERQEMIFKSFVNHAHNDFLEIMFEGGIVAFLLLFFYLVMLGNYFWQNRQDSLRKMALLSIAFLLIHSLVDYPLRTMALALSFAFLNAVVFHAGPFTRKMRREDAMEVEVNGERLLVPMEGAAR